MMPQLLLTLSPPVFVEEPAGDAAVASTPSYVAEKPASQRLLKRRLLGKSYGPVCPGSADTVTRFCQPARPDLDAPENLLQLRLLKSKAIRRLERNQPSNMVPQLSA
jgi:hypothetical protein